MLAETGGAETGVTAASATAVTADELMDLYYSLGRRTLGRNNGNLAVAAGGLDDLRHLPEDVLLLQRLHQCEAQIPAADTETGRSVDALMERLNLLKR